MARGIRITISFSKEYTEEYERLNEEKSKSDIACQAIREYYERLDNKENNENDVLKKLDDIQDLLLEIRDKE